MGEVLNSNEILINRINTMLKNKKRSTVNIINDKLTLSVFAELQTNMEKVKEINLVLRDSSYIPTGREISREFEIGRIVDDIFFNSYEIVEKNKLGHLSKARSMYNFIEKHVNVKKIKRKDLVKSNLILIDEDYAVFGDSSLEIVRKTRKNSLLPLNFNVEITDPEQLKNFKKSFELLWNNKDYTEDFKEQLLENLNFIYKEYDPEFLYFFTLYELFGNQLDSDIERFENDRIGFKDTEIWKSLFRFQKDAVVSAIRKIEKYNGCIIADSVGLGKTFEALAIIKYYELRQHKVLVLTPAKLFDNWDSFRNSYVDNRFAKDRFAYDIICHTDLTRRFGRSRSGLDLSRINWGNYDLVVIDESHNFRNRNDSPERLSRYGRLINEIIKKGVKTKVLMLTATPVNNSLNDLKNQLSTITIDNDEAFKEEGIPSIEGVLRKAQKVINEWSREPNRNKNDLLDRLPSEFFKLLELVTISRSRKHITMYYGNDEIGKFPEKLPPKTYKPGIDSQGELLEFYDTNEKLDMLTLAVYQPMKYIRPEYKQHYVEKFQTVQGDKVLFNHEEREYFVSVLHRFNLFKRLESSVYAFGETLRRLLQRINRYIEMLEKSGETLEVEPDESGEDEELLLDYKYEINVNHLIKGLYLEDLYYDKEKIEELLKSVDTVLKERRDEKLKTLLDFLNEKVTKTPYNPGNKKVLIFTAFADTAYYLYDAIAPEIKKYGINTALVTGTGEPKTTLDIRKEFNTILSHFSPRSKLGRDLTEDEQIDILIATDCISEGQNLQDADCVVNYDIQWNPVILIQRFGRIDRLGSKNERIAMINFFPNLELNEYLRLEYRVKQKMLAVNLTATGEDDILNPDLNDFDFRKKQLERLQQEVVDIDELSDNISLTDLNMNDYLHELSMYVRNHPEIKKIPRGIYSLVRGEKPGCIFCFRHLEDNTKPKSTSSLYPYYLIYVANYGEIYFGNSSSRETLMQFRKLSYGKNKPNTELIELFNQQTKNATDMSFYSNLLNKAINSIKGEEERKAESSIFDFGGYKNEFAHTNADDFELVSFLVVM
ncbi:helicase-related protein [Thermosediminibacter oceani]|uniref:Helicase domain protein n=1 Tax=Thermosediminibacter oceani (strain ATCC BAA-1034 / DSM 16646 / JW/IW-1228P) TaxID=555079 RepID=D9RZB8_THEOJ|nr:helicase-related protein [Thermosediminibacter oceani]ADL08672.1 helicase domain protein [Thermosediminibacter oceani DSM 16646]